MKLLDKSASSPTGSLLVKEGLKPLSRQQETRLAKIALNSRVIIIEGISGSGKDTLQNYLKRKLAGLNLYDYSEGEVLHSWKQLQIKGISELRIRFMKNFVNFMSDIIHQDNHAVFLLNRFHLSTYASTILEHPELGSQYTEIVDGLRALPVHIFILQLDESEIEKRSFHPERTGAWRKFQQQIVQQHNFRERLETQQKVILDAAVKQGIPYSVVKLSYPREFREGETAIPARRVIVRPSVQIIPAKVRKRKPQLPPTV